MCRVAAETSTRKPGPLERGGTLEGDAAAGKDAGAAARLATAKAEAATRAAGMDYLAIPIGSAGFSEPQVERLQDALASAQGPVLGFCRSGTRSTLLWSLAQARSGGDPDAIAEAAASVGYDVSSVRPAMDMFAARAAE